MSQILNQQESGPWSVIPSLPDDARRVTRRNFMIASAAATSLTITNPSLGLWDTGQRAHQGWLRRTRWPRGVDRETRQNTRRIEITAVADYFQKWRRRSARNSACSRAAVLGLKGYRD